MQLIKWFMLVVLVWFVPTFASAQVCETRGRLEICPQTAPDGSRFYRVTPQRGALYGELLGFVNEGVDERLQITAQQIDDANMAKVIYYCPGTDLCTRGICRNGVSRLVNGDDVPRHFDTVCDGMRVAPSRGLVAGTAYRVPAHRALTSTELVADATTTLDNNTHPLAGDVSRALNIGIEAGNDLVHAPSTLALAGLMQAAVNAQGRLAAVASVAAVPSQTNEIPPPVVASASAEATARIVQLESELALAHKLSADRLVVLWLIIGLLFVAIIALVWQHSDQKRKTLVPSVPRVPVPDPGIQKEWERKIANAESERDDAKRELAAVATLFKSVVKAGPYSLDALKTFLGKATEFLTLWSAPLADLTPVKFRNERGEALQFRTMSEAWRTIPKFNLPLSIESLEQVITGWMRLPGVEKEVEHLSAELGQERAKPSGDSALLKPIEQIREQVSAMRREEFGSILSFSDEEHRRVVDTDRVRDRFSTKGSFTSRGRNPKRTEFHDLRTDSLTKFLNGVHRSLGHTLDTVDRMLGHRLEESTSDEEDAAEQPLAKEATQIVANPLLKARDDEQTTRVVTRSAAAPDPEQGEVALRPDHFGARGEPADD